MNAAGLRSVAIVSGMSTTLPPQQLLPRPPRCLRQQRALSGRSEAAPGGRGGLPLPQRRRRNLLSRQVTVEEFWDPLEQFRDH
jgi:hypothetical protein